MKKHWAKRRRGEEYIGSNGRVQVRGFETRTSSKPKAVVVLEEKLGRPLKPRHCAHHLNGIKSDDRPENLEEMSISRHSYLHAIGKTRTGKTSSEDRENMVMLWQLGFKQIFIAKLFGVSRGYVCRIIHGGR